MFEFTNVSIVKQASIYFGGKVTSRTVIFPDGLRKTLGIMLPGEYQFNTDSKEIIEILSGDLEVMISAEDGWKQVRPGESFEVAAKSKFDLKVTSITDYCCSYIGS